MVNYPRPGVSSTAEKLDVGGVSVLQIVKRGLHPVSSISRLSDKVRYDGELRIIVLPVLGVQSEVPFNVIISVEPQTNRVAGLVVD